MEASGKYIYMYKRFERFEIIQGACSEMQAVRRAVGAVVVDRGVVTSWQDDEATRTRGRARRSTTVSKKNGQGQMVSYGIQFYETRGVILIDIVEYNR